ncbi:carbohydrate ABC transporter permease [Mycoplasmopsis alligatoris]|uniref:ABC transporter, permease protein n=1 Tax=Mycoplasmopsis alligatoris A21JP2 TaxID=747682 RepID=D4XWR4_9BACT|nr:carbohydrate ABC transporter permease [Mycoplasmopsis alligatoris]EFF41263.1 ABC transporter, permease protein [Mycoplasmopsis alligatoris A21JP2]
MFKQKLILQNWLGKKRLARNGQKVSQQVHETSLFSLGISLFSKLLILCFFGLIILFPFFYMISTSLMTDQQIEDMGAGKGIQLLPEAASWANYSAAFVEGYWSALGVTFANVLVSVILKIIITMSMGYAFSLKKWSGKKFAWRVLLSLLVLPEVALLAGQYQVVVMLNLQRDVYKTIFAIALPFVASIFNAMMFRNAFEAIPGRIKEVALVDDATGFRYFLKIAAPMVTPTTLTIIILTALASWNSYLWPALVTGNNINVMSTWLFQVGIRRDDSGDNLGFFQNIRMAGAIIVIVPMFIVYFVFRTKIMNAISRQGSTIKG